MPNTYSMVTGVGEPVTLRVCCRSCNEYISTPSSYVENWRVGYNRNVYRGGEGTIVPEMVNLQNTYNAYARMLGMYAESTEDGEYVDGATWRILRLSPSIQSNRLFYMRDLPLVDDLEDTHLVEFICENCLDQLRSLDELRNRRTRMVEEVELEPDDPDVVMPSHVLIRRTPNRTYTVSFECVNCTEREGYNEEDAGPVYTFDVPGIIAGSDTAAHSVAANVITEVFRYGREHRSPTVMVNNHEFIEITHDVFERYRRPLQLGYAVHQALNLQGAIVCRDCVEWIRGQSEILGVTSAEQAERVARWNEEAQRTANDVVDALAAEMSASIDASAIDSIRADRIASNSIQADSLVIGHPIPNRWAPRDAGFEPALRFRGRDWNPSEKLRKSDEFFVKVDPGMPKDFAEFVGMREATVTVGIHDLVKGKYKRLRNSSEQRAIRMECARCDHINVIMHVDITSICSHPQTFMDRMREFIACKCDPVVPEKPAKSGFINRKLRKPKQR